jgi:4-amino-4-deoxy-L-arabinose transferase
MAGAVHRFKPGLGTALVVLYLAVYIAPLGVRPLSTPDEVRYGAISHEMIASGDWVSPRFNGVRYFEKPILGYWLNSISMSVLGENAFALRLPTALAVGLTALLIFWLTLRFASRSSALLASGIYLSTLLVVGVGTTAVLDSFLTLFLTGALATYYVAINEVRRTRTIYLVACGAFCAGAFLTKGFLALAIPVLVVVPYLAARRQWRLLLTSGWIPVVTAVGLVLPWAVLIHVREPDFWHYFFWVEHVNRFFGTEAQHSQPFWYFFRVLPLVGWPWIWMLPAALVGLRRDTGDRAFLAYQACWVVLPWLFFSASHGKLMTYVLPCFPALSILLASGFASYFDAGRRRAWQVTSWLVGLIVAAMLAAAIYAQAGGFGDPLYATDETFRLGFLLACLAAGIGGAGLAAQADSRLTRAAAMAAVGIALFLPFQGALPQRTLDNVMPEGFITPEAAPGTTVLVADSQMFGAVAWYSKRNDIYVVTDGEIAYGMSYPESRHRDLENGGLAELNELIETNRGRHEILIICHDDTDQRIGPILPERAERTVVGQVILWRIPPA